MMLLHIFMTMMCESGTIENRVERNEEECKLIWA